MDENKIYLQALFQKAYRDHHDAYNRVATIVENEIYVTHGMIKQFNTASIIQCETIDAIMAMFKKKDEAICEAFHDTNHNSDRYEPRKPCLFSRTNFLQQVKENPNSRDFLGAIFPRNPENIEQTHSMYIVCKDDNVVAIDRYVLLVVRFDNKQVYYFDPTLDPASNNEVILRILEPYDLLFNAFLPRMHEAFLGNWNVVVHPTISYEMLQNDFDCGVYVLSAILLDYFEVPASLHTDMLARFRLKFAHWLSCGQINV